MISGHDLHGWSCDLLVKPGNNEADLRRGVSGLYYGLLHRLTEEGATAFASFGPGAEKMAHRAYEHGRMFKTCERYIRGQLDWLQTSKADEWLMMLARSFVALKDAREKADYDFGRPFEKAYAIELMEQAGAGHWTLDESRSAPELNPFVAAVLLDERLPRRG